MKRQKHTRGGFPSPEPDNLSVYLVTGGIFLACTAFVVDVFDGTFLKPLVLYALCASIITIELGRVITSGRLSVTFDRAHLMFASYIAAGALSLLLALNLRVGVEALLRQVCYFILFALAFERLDARATIRNLMILLIVVYSVALVHLVLPVSSSLYSLSRQLANISTFGNQTYFAGFLVLVLPLLCADIVLRLESGKNFVFPLLLVVVTLYLLVVTQSRSAWGSALAGVLLLLLLVSKKRVILLISLIGVCVVVAVLLLLFRSTIEPRIAALFEVGPHSSILRRLFFFEGAWKAFLASPILGNGIGNFIVFLPLFRSPDYWMYRSEDIVPHAHNEFLEILSETGVVGFALFALLIGYSFVRMLRRYRALKREDEILLVGIIASLAGVLADNLSSINLRTIPVTACFWMLLGIGLRLSKEADAHPTHKVPATMPSLRLAGAIILLCGTYAFSALAVNAYRVQSRFLEGILLHTNSREKEASGKFEEVLNIDPHHADARFYLVADLMNEGEYAAARRNIDSLLAEYPYYPKAGTLSALCFLELDDTTRARLAIQQELARNRSPQTMYYASLIAQHVGRQADEVEYIMEILRSGIRSGQKDFVRESLNRLLEIPLSELPLNDLSVLLTSYKERFGDDTSLGTIIRSNLARLPSSTR